MLGFKAWKLGLRLQGFHSTASQFPGSVRSLNHPEAATSWPVLTICEDLTNCGVCQVVSLLESVLLTLFFPFSSPSFQFVAFP